MASTTDKHLFSATEVAGSYGKSLRQFERDLKEGKVPGPSLRFPRMRLWDRSQLKQVQALKKK